MPMVIDALTEKQQPAVECEACHKLHKFTAPTWIAIFGAWQQGQQPTRGAHVGKTFGTHDRPTIVCSQTRCILVVMGRESSED